jgi:hypothetical protein
MDLVVVHASVKAQTLHGERKLAVEIVLAGTAEKESAPVAAEGLYLVCVWTESQDQRSEQFGELV